MPLVEIATILSDEDHISTMRDVYFDHLRTIFFGKIHYE